MSKGSRSRRRRKLADEQARQAGEGQPPDDGLIRLDPAQLLGVAAIGPGELPPGLDVDYPGVCALLSEHARIVLPEDGDQVIEPRPEGYAVLALADSQGRKLSVVTVETAKARRAIGMWRTGIAYGEDFAITIDTTVAYLDGWPVPVVLNPEVGGPFDFEDG